MDSTNLRDPRFLLWLGRFVGEWQTSEGPAQIDRRYDGWLEARRLPEYDTIPLGRVIPGGTFVRPPESPLGFYPVRLSRPLMELWLSAEQLSRMSNAWRVSRGMEIIMDAIEKRISEFPEVERNRRWIAWWKAKEGEDPPPPEADLVTLQHLHEEFEHDADNHR